jgi:hypothetical protein
MFVYKKLKASDVSITPSEAHKQYSYDSSSAGANGLTFNTALWTSESKAHYSTNTLAGNFQNHRKYFQLDKMFYRDYITDNANLIPDVNYIKQERRLYDKTNILSIPQNLFGSRIHPSSFNLTGSFNSGNTNIEIRDDGEGNVYPTTYTLGTTNWPSEKGRIVYIGPVKGFKKKDLTTIPGTGHKIVNGEDSFTLENVYDDSYYINQVDYNKVTFNGDTPLTFINTGTEGHLRLDHDSKYNFGFDDDFNISFYFKTSEIDSQRASGSANNGKYYLIAKSDTKTIIPNPGEGQSETLSTFASGNLQALDVPAENTYPFKIYYTDDVDETGSIFFERSNGSLLSFVSTSLFYSGSTDEIIHISAQKTGNELQIWKNGVKTVSGSDIDPVVCKDQPPTNEANLYIGSRGNIDSYLNSNLSQIMIWDGALSATQIQNVSESITGTPYIGNIFYDEGFVTINHPSYSDVLQQYGSSQSQTITLNPTLGDEFNHDISAIAFTNPTYNFTLNPLVNGNFYNQDAKFWFDTTEYSFTNPTTVYNGLVGNFYTFSPQSSNVNLGNVTLEGINREVLRFDFMTASLFDSTDSNIQPFIPSGSNNSITSGYSPTADPTSTSYVFLSSSTHEVAENINILFASNSQVVYTDNFTGSQSSISDTLFGFGSDPVAIGTANLVNFGGSYEDSAITGIHLIATRPNTEDYFLGRLIRVGSPQTSGVGSEDYETTTFNWNTQTIPFGVTQGAQFRTSPHHDIKILTTPPNSVSQPIVVSVEGNISDLPLVEPPLGLPEPARLHVKLLVNGSSLGDILYNDSFTGGDFSATWTSHEGGATDLDLNPGDELTVEIKVREWDNSGNTYDYKITNFEITAPDPGNVFDNHIVVTSSIDTKRSASYTIELNDIDAQAATDVDSRFLGLHQDGNDNDLGVRVNLYKNTGTYSLLTSSFYVSGSAFSGSDFSYTHLTSPTEDETLILYAMAGNATNSGSVEIGLSQSFSLRGPYSVLEKSGSNELVLDTSLGVNFENPDFAPIITFQQSSGSIYGINPVTINSLNGAIATVSDEYLITGSIPATASYFVKQKVSASVELSVVTSSLLTIENFLLGTGSLEFFPLTGYNNNYSSSLTTNNGVPRLRIYSGSNLVNTVVGSNASLKIENEPIGYFASGSTLGIHLDVVDSTSPSTAITSSGGEGFSLNDLSIKGITSSITLSLSESSTTYFDPDINQIQFISPMGSTGNSNLPFNTGVITASVDFVDINTVTLDSSVAALLTTESVSAEMVAADLGSGFPISITWTFEASSTGSIFKFYSGSGFYKTNPLFDLIKTIGEIDANQGLTLFIKDPNGTTIASSSFINTASVATEDLLLSTGYEFTSSTAGTHLIELKTTNSHSVEIPVTWDVGISSFISSYNATQPGSFPGEPSAEPNLSPVLTELSASYGGFVVHNGIAASNFSGELGTENMFRITSTHTNTGSFPNSPFTTGINEIQGFVETETGNTTPYSVPNTDSFRFITLDTPLFITGGLELTGGLAETQYFLTQESQSATSLPSPITEGNFTIGDTQYNIESINGVNFIIDTPLILTGSTNVTLNYEGPATNDFTVNFKNSHLIFEHEYQCSIDEDEYNFTQNVSTRKNKSNQSADLADCVTGSIDNSQITLFKPYVTTVGLYDDDLNLLAVGKFAQPVKTSEEADMTFVIRWDT